MENIEKTKESVRTTFPERLKTLRETIGVSQSVFASRLGVSRAAISYYEKGERVPDIAFVEAVRELTGCSLNYLLGYSDNMGDYDNFSDFVMEYELSDRQMQILKSLLENPVFQSLLKQEELPRFFDELGYYSFRFGGEKCYQDFIIFKTVSGLASMLRDAMEQGLFGNPVEKIEETNEKLSQLQENVRESDIVWEKASEYIKEVESRAQKLIREEEELAQTDAITRFRLALNGRKEE